MYYKHISSFYIFEQYIYMYAQFQNFLLLLNTIIIEDLQDGRGVRRGDHLPPHKYIRNTST